MDLQENSLIYMTKAKDLLSSLIKIIHDPINKFTKEQMGKITPITSELLGTTGLMAVRMGILEGELSAFKSIPQTLSSEVNSQIPPSNMCDVLTEIEERKMRANNVILFNIPESVSDLTAINISEDNNKVSTALKNIDISINTQEIKIYRLGAKKVTGKIRPIKLELKDSQLARTILINNKKFKDGIKAGNDQTLQQRRQLITLREELESRRNNGETNLTIKYVNSSPKIIEMQPNGVPKNG